MSGCTVISRTALNPLACRSRAYTSTCSGVARHGSAQAVSATIRAGVPSACCSCRPEGDILQKPCSYARTPVALSPSPSTQTTVPVRPCSPGSSTFAPDTQCQSPACGGAKRRRQTSPPSQKAGRRSTSLPQAKSAQTSTEG